MKIELLRLTLVNFKGARNLIVDFSDITALIGRNETGKTTLFDAWYWLLFDKDSLGKKEFGIKTTDENHNVLHGLTHSAEGLLSVDGKRILLKKEYSESWVKKRGSSTEEFTGHTTKYSVDEVPMGQREYKNFVDSIVSEDTFRLLTDPMYFNVQISWQQRRALLLQVCGDITDADVIASDEALEDLPAILGDHELEDYRKILVARRTKINKELTALPVRIDEAERSKPDVDGVDKPAQTALIDTLRSNVEAKEAELTRLQTGGEITVLEKRAAEIDGELLSIKNAVQADSSDAIAKQRTLVSEVTNKHSKLSDEIESVTEKIQNKTTSIAQKDAETKRLRIKWKEINEEAFAVEIEGACTACGQELPEEKVQASHDKALAIFNKSKSERLEEAATKGKTSATESEKLVAEKSKLIEKQESLLHEFSAVEESKESAEHELDRLLAQSEEYKTDITYVAKLADKEAVKNRIAAVRSSALPEIERVRKESIDARDELRRQETVFANFTQIETLDTRITELKAEERKLAAEYESTEHELHLTETFVRSKVALMDERINSKFEITRFKLFKEQVNGGLEECCVALRKGVAYDTGLNTGGRILVGLDVIRILQRHYDIYAPVWVDNNESLTSDVDMDCQLIELIASRKDKVLRVEHAKREAV